MGLTKSKNIKQAKNSADEWFSKYIRLRDCDSNGFIRCITCNESKRWNESDAGHFQSRRFLATRFNEYNVNAQCKGCNSFGAGEQFKHGKAIDLKFGEGIADELETESRRMVKFSKVELMEMAREFKDKAEELAQQKGIEL